MDEREVGGAVAERLDHRRVVGRDGDAHRDADQPAQHPPELVTGGQEVGRLLRGREHEVQRRLGARRRAGDRERGRQHEQHGTADERAHRW